MLVTGATGFLGKPLVQRLISGGYQVTALGRRQKVSPFGPEVEWAAGDLADRQFAGSILHPWRWDALVNAAGPVPKKDTILADDYGVLSSHVGIALGVCAAVPYRWSGRFMHISTMSVYGVPEHLPVSENHPLRPINVYGTAKALTDEIVLAWMRKQDADCWVLRLPGLFSQTRQSGAIYNFALAALRGRPIAISASQPTPWDVLHVDDAVEAVVRAIGSESCNPGAVNISYGEPVELGAIARLIVEISRSSSEVQNPSDTRHPVFQMDITRARHLLGWPPYTLRERLERFCRTVGSETGASNVI